MAIWQLTYTDHADWFNWKDLLILGTGESLTMSTRYCLRMLVLINLSVFQYNVMACMVTWSSWWVDALRQWLFANVCCVCMAVQCAASWTAHHKQSMARPETWCSPPNRSIPITPYLQTPTAFHLLGYSTFTGPETLYPRIRSYVEVWTKERALEWFIFKVKCIQNNWNWFNIKKEVFIQYESLHSLK